MNTDEREKRLAHIRAQLNTLKGTGRELAGWADKCAFLLSEFDAACKALHDRNEETGYAEGYAAGVKAERERLAALVVNFPSADHSPEEYRRLRREAERAMQGNRGNWLVLPTAVAEPQPAVCLSHPEHDWDTLTGTTVVRCRRCGSTWHEG